MGTYVPMSLSALVLDRLSVSPSSSCSVPRTSGHPHVAPASSFSLGHHLNVPSKQNHQGDCRGSSPLSPDEEILSRSFRLAQVEVVVSNSTLFRLFCSASYVILSQYQVCGRGEVPGSGAKLGELTSPFSSTAKPVRAPLSCPQGKVTVVPEQDSGDSECVAACSSSSSLAPSAGFSGDATPGKERDDAEGASRVRGCSRMTSKQATALLAEGGGSLPGGTASASEAGARPSRLSPPRPEEALHVPLPLQLVSADLWRVVAAAATENARLFLRLSELQRTLITYGEKKMKRYLSPEYTWGVRWRPESSDTQLGHCPRAPNAGRICRREGETRSKQRASKEETVDLVPSLEPREPEGSREHNGATDALGWRGGESELGVGPACLEKAVREFVQDIADRFALMYAQQVGPSEEEGENGDVLEQRRNKENPGKLCDDQSRAEASAQGSTSESTGDFKKPRVSLGRSISRHPSKKNLLLDRKDSVSGRPTKVARTSDCKREVERSRAESPARLHSVTRDTKSCGLAFSRGAKEIPPVPARVDPAAISLRCKQSPGTLRTRPIKTPRATAAFLRGVNQDRSRGTLSRGLRGGETERQQSSGKRATKRRRRLLRAKLERLRQRAVAVHERAADEAEREKNKTQQRSRCTREESEVSSNSVERVADGEGENADNRTQRRPLCCGANDAVGGGRPEEEREKSEERVGAQAEEEKIEDTLEVLPDRGRLSQEVVEETGHVVALLGVGAAAADIS